MSRAVLNWFDVDGAVCRLALIELADLHGQKEREHEYGGGSGSG